MDPNVFRSHRPSIHPLFNSHGIISQLPYQHQSGLTLAPQIIPPPVHIPPSLSRSGDSFPIPEFITERLNRTRSHRDHSIHDFVATPSPPLDDLETIGSPLSTFSGDSCLVSEMEHFAAMSYKNRARNHNPNIQTIILNNSRCFLEIDTKVDEPLICQNESS
ncbi:hypothetical protein GEMRC1_008149 [Eukaryota sp. GEM-RC1]